MGAAVVEQSIVARALAPVDVRDPAISPGAGSLAALPPLLIQVGSTEVLLEQSQTAFRQARASGGTAELQIWPQMPHVFQAVHWLPEAWQALLCVRDFVECHERATTAASSFDALVAPGCRTRKPVPPASIFAAGG